VHQHPLGFWMLTRYDEVSTLLRSGLSVEVRHLAPTPQSEMYLELGGDPDGRRGGGLSMLDRDPPDHTRLRKLVAKVFTPRAVAGLEPHIVELVDAALDQIADAGQVNLVETLAFPLPFAVISEMLGVPKSNHERVRELRGILVRSLEPVN